MGENKYNATINVKITIKKQASKTDLTITSVEPKVHAVTRGLI